MKLALTAGGTGGHIFPAMAVLDAARSRYGEGLEVRFFGPDSRGEREMVAPHGLSFERIPSAAVRGKGPLQLLRGALSLATGIALATAKFLRWRPDVVFSTGGYASFPATVAARLTLRPLVVYLPDVTPGWAVRAEARLATRMATTADAALAHLPASKTTVTGYPVRQAFFDTSRDEARAVLGLPANARMLLVAGASQGARSINAAIFEGLPALTRACFVAHVTGSADLDTAEQVRATLPAEQQARYVPAAFRSDLPVAMLAADLAIMRAGASVLGELTAAGLPALLVPGTFAGGHQADNARWLADQGAAEVVTEEQLENLGPRALALLGNPSRLQEMRARAASLVRPGAAEAIVDILVEVRKR